MADNFVRYARLEPRPFARDLTAGFAAAIHDPVWFLGRQWQMGEHQGENASSPIWVNYDLVQQPLRAADPRFDPTVIPAEAIVESEIDDWWTMGRRVRMGQRLQDHPALQARDDLRFHNPPPPYERFQGQFDGRAVWRARAELGLADEDFGVAIPPDSTPAWDSERLLYRQGEAEAFATAAHRLAVQEHRGGRMDWYAVMATAEEGAPDPEPVPGQAIPTMLHYPGAPASRWWQIEDAEVDVGGYVPDSAHTPTAFLTELVFSHSDDWFLFPVQSPAGYVVTMATLAVRDVFGRTYSSQERDGAGEWLYPGLQPPPDWTLFQVDGLPANALLLWHVAELPLASAPLERVQFGLDEEANLLWAVERLVDGREVASRRLSLPDEVLHPPFNAGRPAGDARKAREYAYVPGQGAAPYWYPYELTGDDELRRLVQRRLVDFSRQRPMPLPLPQAELLQPPEPGRGHQIAPLAIPSNGIEVERRWQLARDMHGNPVLWLQRQRAALLSPPARRLRFDVMVQAAEPA